jgi:hypothetical protein
LFFLRKEIAHMNLAVGLSNRTNDLNRPGWQPFCVPDLSAGNGSLRLFTEGDDLHDAMISADEVGWRFARALSVKARSGVEVRFHFDSRGAATRYSLDIFREMVAAGVKLRWYRP